MRSEFFGDIYDVGLNGVAYEDVKTDHPFYILVLGHYSQVKQYFDEVKSGSQKTKLNFSDKNFVIFSTQIFEKPALLEIKGNEQPILATSLEASKDRQSVASKQLKSDNPQKSGIRRVDLINDGNVLIKIDSSSLQNVERLIVAGQATSDSSQEVPLEYTLNYNPLPYTLPLADSVSYQLNNKSDFNRDTKEFEPLKPQNLSIPVRLTNWRSINNNQLKFNALINRENNPQSVGVYRLVFDILPEKISGSTRPYQAPSWWMDWSFGEEEFAGDKTYNLQPFIYNLGDTTFRIIENKSDVVLGRLCFVVQKK